MEEKTCIFWAGADGAAGRCFVTVCGLVRQKMASVKSKYGKRCSLEATWSINRCWGNIIPVAVYTYKSWSLNDDLNTLHQTVIQLW